MNGHNGPRARKLDIGIIASSDHPIEEPFAGGLEAHTDALARRLRDRGHSVTLFASDKTDPGPGIEPVLGQGPMHFSNRAKRDPSMVAVPFLEQHHSYLDLMLRLRESSFDLIQNSSLHYLPVAMARVLQRPIVTTLHTPPTPWLESAACTEYGGSSTVFVSVSETNAKAWTSISIDEVIPNGADTDQWTFRPASDGDFVVWTGRIVPEKGPHLAVEVAHSAGSRLVMAGPIGDQAYFDDEVRPRLSSCDEYAGHLRTKDLVDLVGRASATLVTPCWDEPFGLVVIESLSCGTPVVAFDRGAMREILADYFEAHVVPFGDVEAMASAVAGAVNCDRSRCRELVEERYSMEVMTTRYEDLYSRLCGEKS